jgi:hypothetical protein
VRSITAREPEEINAKVRRYVSAMRAAGFDARVSQVGAMLSVSVEVEPEQITETTRAIVGWHREQGIAMSGPHTLAGIRICARWWPTVEPRTARIVMMNASDEHMPRLEGT